MTLNTDTQQRMPVRGKRQRINTLLPSRLYCRYRSLTGSILFYGSRGLYRRSGISPCPEEWQFELISIQN